MTCDHCDGSGVLNILASMVIEPGSLEAGDVLDSWDVSPAAPYASPCHCAVGKMWTELGLE